MTLPSPVPCPYCEHDVRPGRRCWGCGRADPLSEVDADAGPPESWTATLAWCLLASDNLRGAGPGHSHAPEYVQARDGAALYLSDQYDHPPMQGPVRVSVEFYPPDRRRRDCVNLLKALHDALELAEVVEDDAQIRAWEGAVMEPTGDGHATVTVTQMVGMGWAA